MTEVRPLYYVGIPTEEARLALRAGKESLQVDWMVKPMPYTGEEDGPVLAFEEPRFYIHTYAKLTPPYTSSRMAAALRELYGLAPPDHLMTGEQWLSGFFMGGVKFVEEETTDA